MRATDCDFCEIVDREESAREVYRDHRIVAFFPTEPAVLGHVMIIPRQHIPDIWSLDHETAGYLAKTTQWMAKAIRTALSPDGMNIIQSNGAAATQSVFHLHVHLVPRWENDPMGPIWPERTNYSESKKDEVLKLVRSAAGVISRKDR